MAQKSKKLIFLFFLFVSGNAVAIPAKITMVQYDASGLFGQYDENLKNLFAFSRQAVEQGSKLIVFPEGAVYGYAGKDLFWCRTEDPDKNCKDVTPIAEVIPGGPTTTIFEKFSRDHGVYLFFHIPEKEPLTGRLFTTVAVTGPKGYVGKYRKRNLYYVDSYFAEKGEFPTLISTEFGLFGILICMDGNYADLYQEYKKLDVDAIVMLMDWDEDPRTTRGAKNYFQMMAYRNNMPLIISDNSKWDGTGYYLSNEQKRVRQGMPSEAVGKDGIAYSTIDFGQ